MTYTAGKLELLSLSLQMNHTLKYIFIILITLSKCKNFNNSFQRSLFDYSVLMLCGVQEVKELISDKD